MANLKMMDKPALRKHFIPMRKGAFTGDPKEVACRLEMLLSRLDVSDFVLGAYLPIRNEWDPWPVISMLGGNRRTAIPLTPTEPGPLTFRQWAQGDETVDAMFKTQEPLACAPLVPLENIVFLVPGVAIDRRGIRLGYGGGYYDRTFARLGKQLDRNLVIGFMLDEQISNNDLSCEPTDVPMGHLITPTRSIAFQRKNRTLME